MESIVSDSYVTLDDPEQLALAQERPKAFLDAKRYPYGIDECQLAPALFPALKLHVQQHKKKGQFILTGSVRFSARKAIRESLTGRIQLLELHPMTLSEAHGHALPDLALEVNQGFRSFARYAEKRAALTTTPACVSYLEHGGLPGICFLRDRAARRPRWNSHLDTLLGRDIHLVSETTHPPLKLRELLVTLAQTQGNPLSITELSRKARISKLSLAKLLNALEALFLVRRVLPLGDTQREAFFLEDQGVSTHLAFSTTPQDDWNRLCFSQIFPHLNYRDPGGVTLYHFETRNGAKVPLVFRTKDALLGVIPVGLETPDKKATASAQSFIRHFPNSHVLILTQGASTLEYAKNIWATPMRACF
jgi:predicted AAA+ superfamily ATPase